MQYFVDPREVCADLGYRDFLVGQVGHNTTQLVFLVGQVGYNTTQLVFLVGQVGHVATQLEAGLPRGAGGKFAHN